MGIAELNSPLNTFEEWFLLAEENERDPSAFTLSTVSKEGRPKARTLLYKGMSTKGPRFFTNYQGRKASDLAHCPFASMVFYWPIIGRQVRLEGLIEKIGAEESKEYFHSRSFESQVASLISGQSSTLESEEAMYTRFKEGLKTYEGQEVPFDEKKWGGYQLVPNCIEFFTYGEHRLSVRQEFSLGPDEKTWSSRYLWP